MYHLRKNPLAITTAQSAREMTGRAEQRLKDASAGLVFDPVPHTYTLYGKPLSSVSNIVGHFAPFDTAAKAEAVSKNPKHPLYGKTPEEIIAIWEEKRDAAAAAGTQVHAFGEACCLWMTGREDEIEPEYRDRVTADGLAAISPKEEAAARWWESLDWSRYAVVAKEARIVNPELRYAGTFDLLLYDTWNDGFALKDYKSNEDLYKWYGDYLLPPLNMLRSNDIGKYTVQQSLYSIELRNIGLRVVSNELIWLKDDGFFEAVALETRYQKVIEYAVRELAATS